MVDIGSGFSEDPAAEARALVAELGQYSPELAKQPRWLVFSKCELMPQEEVAQLTQAVVDALGWEGPVFLISSMTREGIKPLCDAVFRHVRSLDEPQGTP